jgi:hypothetical protein
MNVAGQYRHGRQSVKGVLHTVPRVLASMFIDVAGFERLARLACATAKDLAPYQSPTYRAVVIAPPPDKPGDDVTVIDLSRNRRRGSLLKRSMGAQLRPGSPLMIAITIDHPYRPIGTT